MRTKLPDMLRKELERCPVPWRVENGTRHIKLFVNGQLAGVFSRGRNARADVGRDNLNIRAQIRRIVKRVENP